ncbi:MAG: hypothetical protein M3O91_10410, partial [Chloroflexota bacterium]|nr:hypothetical protein [Chloroflexota bacterium]
SWLTSVAARMGELPRGAGGWATALEAARRMGDPVQEATVRRQRALGLAAGADPDWPAILEDLERAAALFEASEARPALARTLRDQGRALDALGRRDDAAAARARAAQLGREIGLRDASGA